MYRKLKYILVVSVLSINLYACGSGELVLSESQENGTSVAENITTDTNKTEGMNNMQVINPIKQVTAEELQEQMQISQVGECEAIVYIKDDVGYIAWLNLETGIVYNLGMTEGTDKDALINLANEIFK